MPKNKDKVFAHVKKRNNKEDKLLPQITLLPNKYTVRTS